MVKKSSSEQKCFFIIVFIFLYLRFFLVKRHKTFNMVLVSNPFFWIGYTFILVLGFG